MSVRPTPPTPPLESRTDIPQISLTLSLTLILTLVLALALALALALTLPLPLFLSPSLSLSRALFSPLFLSLSFSLSLSLARANFPECNDKQSYAITRESHNKTRNEKKCILRCEMLQTWTEWPKT